MNAAPTLIIFDLVSTLTDAGPRYAKAYRDVCISHGLPAPETGHILEALGDKNLRQIIADYSPDLQPAQIPAFMNACNTYCDNLLDSGSWVEHLMPDVGASLYDLTAKGYTLGIYSGTREDAIHAQIAYHGIGAYFDNALIRGKDNARDAGLSSADLKAQQIAGIAAQFALRHNADSDILVVGDSLSDLEAARAVDCRFVGISPRTSTARRLHDAGAHWILPSVDVLARTLPAIAPAPAEKKAFILRHG